MLLINYFDLQRFADGGDGASAGESSEVASGVNGNSGEDLSAQIPRSIPERARKRYMAALKATHKAASEPEEDASTEKHSQENSTEPPTATPKEEAKQTAPTYAELIKSEAYKADHDAYMQKTIQDRFKKYSGMEEENNAARDILYGLAEKFGIDSNSKTFFEDLKAKMTKDDSDDRVRKYAEEHDVDEEEARRIIDMENKITEQKRSEEIRKAAEEEAKRKQAQEESMKALRASAEKTKAMYPNFDLKTMIQNEEFRRILAVTDGNTTAAYVAVDHKRILQDTAQAAAEKAMIQATNAVASNASRPAENGLADTSSSVADIDFSGMNAKQLREFWQKNRNMLRR